MREIFLSASVPVPGRGHYHETANPFLIQVAVRELLIATVRHHRIVWGGHPSITPMIWAICEDMGVSYADQVVLYQTQFFEDIFPVENEHFNNVQFTPVVNGDRDQSLALMRESMLSRPDIDSAVFIGGMDGVEVEYELLTRFHPAARVLPVAATGGAALDLAQRSGRPSSRWDLDFVSLFRSFIPDDQ
ncbi:TPA: hypothetical protein ACGCGJ_000249 [Stenotrophomonas maltophilia]|uniref:SLOG domain-containing protein n=1 Tax=Stenotrophomonas maltophilia TaxID=40324 RepID=UPI000DA88CA6|nr:hypothetical protein [Stenotrophomonas maltophilia]MCU1012455.1 hypothetical protein [Stenotrophomonas maltophilia]PZS89327.1 hypothetical protein A7X66_03530 [Stenotrophomonas maltophilia]UXF74423.1 hypothetical protein K7574_10435 [Stenotrophomonas maltophilia]